MKKVAIILAIITCIGVFSACVADKADEASTTSTTATTTNAPSTDLADETSTSTTSTTAPVADTSITVKQALEVLGDKYGDDYSVRATVVENNIQYFSIDDENTGERYARVAVDLNTSQATETIMQTQETTTFSLNG